MEINELDTGMEISGDTLSDIFKCSKQGGMRRSLKTNTLVLISNRIKSLYNDEFRDEYYLDDVLRAASRPSDAIGLAAALA